MSAGATSVEEAVCRSSARVYWALTRVVRETDPLFVAFSTLLPLPLSLPVAPPRSLFSEEVGETS